MKIQDKESLYFLGDKDKIKQTLLNLMINSIEATKNRNTEYKSAHNIKIEAFAENDNILIIDDFLANGQAVLGMIDIVNQAKATVAGVGIVVEKGFQDGRKLIENQGYRVESLAIVDDFKDGTVILR